MNDTERETPVIFTWADREGSSWWLAAFIFLAFLLHSAAFFVFHRKDPIAPTTVRTAPAVQILTASPDPAVHSPETDALLQWIATNDPALVAKIQTVEPQGLLDVPYRPSFQTLRTPPLAAPPEPPTFQFPPARDPLALVRSLSPSMKPSFPIPAMQSTQVRLSAALEVRTKEKITITPRTRTSVTVEPTTILTGVTAEGEARFAFIQQGSGDRALDAEALAFVRTLRFGSADEPLNWGAITIAWGDDASVQLEPAR